MKPTTADKSKDKSRPRRRRRRGKPGAAKPNANNAAGEKPAAPRREAATAVDESKYVSKPHVPKRYGIVFYDSLAAARADLAAIAEKAQSVDQLNIVIRAEGDMDDPDLVKYGKVFAGSAWTLIHERRVEEGWYEEPR